MNAYLELEDGTLFRGEAFGALHSTTGECVFNTGMTGYPETLTDPSYRGQIITLTYPLIGNYGVPTITMENGLTRNAESERIQVQALVVSEYCHQYSHWAGVRSLDDWLKEHDIPGICGIDTRALTKRLRREGTMNARLVVDEKAVDFQDTSRENHVAAVSIKEPVRYGRGDKTVGVLDCGAKSSMIKALLDRGVAVLRLPWDADPSDHAIDALLVSNGPGNPKMCEAAIGNLRNMLEGDKPVFGICLGHQLLALAAGANTYKLKYGHRSQNQPCVQVGTRRCYITSQNHGYAVDEKTLPADWENWFFNANDSTNEGLRHRSKPFFSVQFHPEAVPGPCDTAFLFDQFVGLLR